MVRVRKYHIELAAVGTGFALAVVGLLYFNWLIAAAQSV